MILIKCNLYLVVHSLAEVFPALVSPRCRPRSLCARLQSHLALAVACPVACTNTLRSIQIELLAPLLSLSWYHLLRSVPLRCPPSKRRRRRRSRLPLFPWIPIPCMMPISLMASLLPPLLPAACLLHRNRRSASFLHCATDGEHQKPRSCRARSHQVKLHRVAMLLRCLRRQVRSQLSPHFFSHRRQPP